MTDPEAQRAVRKAEHLALAVQLGDADGPGPGWDDVQLVHDALPDSDFEEISLDIDFLGEAVRLPLIVAGMTGGHDEATPVNRALARAAAAAGAVIGVGSQRGVLSSSRFAATYNVIRDEAPDAFVIANIGISQLMRMSEDREPVLDEALRAVEMLKADALAVHLNFLEEIVQPEGQTRARGAAAALRDVVRNCPVPVIAKETGSGLSYLVARRLASLGVQALDVGGMGGTSFAAIEAARARSQGDATRAETGDAFSDWGISTAVSVALCSPVLPTVATGGVRNGLDAAKAIALGATAVGVGRPLLEQALKGEAAVSDWIAVFAHQLRAAIFLSGSRSGRQLQSAPTIVTGRTRSWLDHLLPSVISGSE